MLGTPTSLPWSIHLLLCLWLVIELMTSLQLPLPTPNPILVAFGNLTVRGLYIWFKSQLVQMETIHACTRTRASMHTHTDTHRHTHTHTHTDTQHAHTKLCIHQYTFCIFSQPERYVLEVLKRIRSSELEESLLVMPFDFVVDLLHLLKHWLEVS